MWEHQLLSLKINKWVVLYTSGICLMEYGIHIHVSIIYSVRNLDFVQNLQPCFLVFLHVGIQFYLKK